MPTREEHTRGRITGMFNAIVEAVGEFNRTNERYVEIVKLCRNYDESITCNLKSFYIDEQAEFWNVEATYRDDQYGWSIEAWHAKVNWRNATEYEEDVQSFIIQPCFQGYQGIDMIFEYLDTGVITDEDEVLE